MSTVPHFTTPAFKVWLAGSPVYRPQNKALFAQLAEGIASRDGPSPVCRDVHSMAMRNAPA